MASLVRHRRCCLWTILLLLLLESLPSSVSSLSLLETVLKNNKNNNINVLWNRRSALATVPTAAAGVIAASTTSLPASAIPAREFIAPSWYPTTTTKGDEVLTVIVEDKETAASLGLIFEDKIIMDDDDGEGITTTSSSSKKSKPYPVVKSVQSGSIADSIGVKEGMVLLYRGSQSKASKDNIEFRIRNGPYPFLLQFYDYNKNKNNNTQKQDDPDDDILVQQQGSSSKRKPRPNLDPYDRMSTKTVYKPKDCSSRNKSKRGDIVEISYEARILSSSEEGTGTVLYDATAWRGGKTTKIELGKRNFDIEGVDAGLTGMCIGEIRELDISALFGYGKFGSEIYDVPGDVRLLWKVELLDIL